MQADSNTCISGTRWFFCIMNSMYSSKRWRDQLNPPTIFDEIVVWIRPNLASLRLLQKLCT